MGCSHRNTCLGHMITCFYHVIQPPVEALQMALILDDSCKTLSLSDLEKRIQEVLSVVPGRSTEEANVALHDNDFDMEKAISALLDSDSGMGTVSGCGLGVV